MARNSLLKNYHRLAEDALLGDRSSADDPIISASANGQWERVEAILEQHRSCVDARSRDTGDTPLIAAARNGHTNVVKLLLKYGADVTLQNDLGETALEVGNEDMRKLILSNVTHEGRTMTTAQALLQSAWLGDSVSVKKHLSGSHYIDVNCKNSDGLTPMLLVTRDIALFEKVHNAMTTEYNPVKVLEDLIENQADINACDKQGRSALHLVATSDSIHAKRMVSLLVKQGSNSDSLDSKSLAPLHVASSEGHMSIIVALVEEGGADINSRGGEQKDTPLILTARSGHNEAAKYLLTKGADITMVNENGDTALSVAKSQSMIQILKEAWTEHAQAEKKEKDIKRTDEQDCSPEGSSPSSPVSPQEKSCFLTERQMTKSFEYEDSDFTDHETLRDKPHHGSFPGLLPACSEAEADDEFEDDSSRRRLRHAKHRAQIRATFEGSISKRKQERKDLVESPRRNSGDWKSKSLPKHYKDAEYSSIDDDFIQQQMNSNGRGDEERGKPTSGLLSEEQQWRESRNKREELVRGDGHKGKEQSFKDTGQMKEVGHSKEAGRGGWETRGDERQEQAGYKRNEQKNIVQPKGLLGRLSRHILGGLHDRSHSQESLPTTSSGLIEGKDSKKPILPAGVPGIKTPSAGKNKDQKKTSMEHLPVLSHMQPVALVSVEVDRQRLHIQQFRPKDGHGNSHQTMTRSQSLSVVKHGTDLQGVGGDGSHKKRNSTGSVLLGQEMEKSHGTRVPLLPSVVAPHFEPHHTSQKPKARGRLQPLSLSTVTATATATPHINITAAHLSIVNEDSEGSGSDRTLTNSSEPRGANSKVKSSDVEPSRKPGSEQTIVSPVQKSPISTSNTLVHFAEANGSIPLSPIWNQMQYLRTDSDTSSNSEYILSYIGQEHPAQTPDPTERKPGVDSGHGESDEEQVASEGSEGEIVQMGDKEVLKWKRGRLLGRGAYGKVWEGLMDSAKMVAVKEVELDSDPDRAQAQFEKIQIEVDILRSLRHKNIVSYLGTSMHGSVVYIFMDFISGGSLQSILKRFGQLDEKTISHYTRQIVKGLDYLHSNGIVHRDIKGANIMVTSRGIIKLIDFGCAKKYCQEMSGEMHSVRGTPYWMAPEVICGQGYGRKSDIWSLGCTVHEMGTTKPPWAELPPESALFNIGLGTAVCTPPDHFSSDLRDFVFAKCLTRDQALRPSAHELLEHRFLLMAKSCGPKQQQQH